MESLIIRAAIQDEMSRPLEDIKAAFESVDRKMDSVFRWELRNIRFHVFQSVVVLVDQLYELEPVTLD